MTSTRERIARTINVDYITCCKACQDATWEDRLPLADSILGLHSETQELAQIVEWMDNALDEGVSQQYKDQPLAQDWARVAKVGEEAGEAIDALIGLTGQNPRKGQYGSMPDLLDELADVALTGMYAIQHFTKSGEHTLALLLDRARHHKERMT